MEIPAALSHENNCRLMWLGLRWSNSNLSLKKDLRFFVNLIYTFGVVFYALYVLNYSLFFHDIKNDRNTEACKNAFMDMVAINVIFKFIVLNYHRQTIESNVKLINNDYQNMPSMPESQNAIVHKYAKKSLRMCQLWLFLSTATAVIFPLKAGFLMSYYAFMGKFRYVQVFEHRFPDFLQTNNPTLEPVIFVLFFVLEVMFACFAATMFLGFEPLGPSFMLHACGQLEIVESKILRLYLESEDRLSTEKKLTEIISTLQKVYKFVHETNSIFAAVYEINSKCTIIGIPFVAIQILEAASHSEINLEFMSFFIGLFFHGFVPCYYSDLLKEKGESIRQAIYACGWETDKDLKRRRTLFFMLVRATKPPVIRSVFSTLCLDNFADMCHSSYTLFNLLNASS